MDGRSDSARAVALVGPAGTGKTTLMEALLYVAGATDRRGSVDAGNSVGDASPEARARHQSVEINVARFQFGGDHYAIVDCPGGVEFAGDGDAALAACDLALVVIDPDPAHAALVQPALKQLEALGVPHAIFVNKIETARARIRDLMAALQPMSSAPLVARQIPIWEGEHVAGFVDLALERAFHYRPGQASQLIAIRPDLADREAEARTQMLEQLADHDDELLEQLLSDVAPGRDLIFRDLARETGDGLIVPVFFGSASNGFGVRRLLKALRHDTPAPAAAAARLNAASDCAYVFKISHAGQAGKLAIARVLSGKLGDGCELTLPSGEKARAGGLFTVQGGATAKTGGAGLGEVIAIAKVGPAKCGDLLSADGKARTAPTQRRRAAAHTIAIATKDHKDDVRLADALTKLVEEEPALEIDHDRETRQVLLKGAGETNLRVVLDRLQRRFGVAVNTARPAIPYRESVRRAASGIRGRHKKQSGGHGQFGDVVIDMAPQARGAGVTFGERITGGAVPKQWIPAVEQGIRDACAAGPLGGFPVVDVAVTLVDGSYHSVDSSELAFRTAGRLAMAEALKTGGPYLLEPVDRIEIFAPQSATSKITASVSGRRGQVLGFDAREGWPGWDRIEVYLPQSERADLAAEVYLPQSERADLAAELRALSQGLATYTATFDHLAELSGRHADQVLGAAKAA